MKDDVRSYANLAVFFSLLHLAGARSIMWSPDLEWTLKSQRPDLDESLDQDNQQHWFLHKKKLGPGLRTTKSKRTHLPQILPDSANGIGKKTKRLYNDLPCCLSFQQRRCSNRSCRPMFSHPPIQDASGLTQLTGSLEDHSMYVHLEVKHLWWSLEEQN